MEDIGHGGAKKGNGGEANYDSIAVIYTKKIYGGLERGVRVGDVEKLLVSG